MLKAAATYVIGLLFGLGLTVSSMVNPAKVLNFLDVAGQWDPSLALVMASALVVAAIGYQLSFKRRAPVLADAFLLPAARSIDAKLITGAALFGVGWGMAGLCPGPAIAALSVGGRSILIFAVSMLGAICVWRWWSMQGD